MAGTMQILVAIDEFPARVWEGFESKATITFVRDGREARALLQKNHFHIVLVDIFLPGVDGLQLLRLIQEQEDKPAVILTSEAPNFQYARQGILYGACDYLLRPLNPEALQEAFQRVQAQHQRPDSFEQTLLQGLIHALGTPGFPAALEASFHQITTREPDQFNASHRCLLLFQALVRQAYEMHSWLSCFLDPKECETITELNSSDPQVVQTVCQHSGEELNKLLMSLYPPQADAQLTEIMEYMLMNVDRLFAQKEIAQKFYLSASTLSERFSRSLEISYREYNQGLKISRAAYLLRNTDMKLYEVCAKLGFKDTSYFSKQFKQQTGQTATSYRQEPYWDFQI